MEQVGVVKHYFFSPNSACTEGFLLGISPNSACTEGFLLGFSELPLISASDGRCQPVAASGSYGLLALVPQTVLALRGSYLVFSELPL